jgi:hypothetical protein
MEASSTRGADRPIPRPSVLALGRQNPPLRRALSGSEAEGREISPSSVTGSQDLPHERDVFDL